MANITSSVMGVLCIKIIFAILLWIPGIIAIVQYKNYCKARANERLRRARIIAFRKKEKIRKAEEMRQRRMAETSIFDIHFPNDYDESGGNNNWRTKEDDMNDAVDFYSLDSDDDIWDDDKHQDD